MNNALEVTDKKKPRVVRIDIVSDTMWPNGFLGKQHLAEAIDEMNFASQLDEPLQFEVYRIPFLLEFGYNESEEFKETHIQRMKRNMEGYSCSSGYEKCT